MPRILVIDDDAEMRALLEQTLKSAGHEILSAEDGEQALRLHRAQPASLVITDIFMPGKEGLETIRSFRREFPKAPLIAISGKPDFGNALQVALRLGAAKTLAKPFQQHELLALVASVLETHPAAPAQVVPRPFGRRGPE